MSSDKGREIQHLKRRAHPVVRNSTRAADKRAAIMEGMEGDTDMSVVIAVDFPRDDDDEYPDGPSDADLAEIEREFAEHPLEDDDFFLSEDYRPAEFSEDDYPSGPLDAVQE